MHKEYLNLDGLNTLELQKLLKEIKLYRDLVKQLGKRGKVLYNKLKNKERTFLVEYYSAMREDIVFEEANKIYKHFFNIEVYKNMIEFVKKDSLEGGIKVYLDDYMIDLSYKNIKDIIKN